MNPQQARLYELLNELKTELDRVELDEQRSAQLEALMNSIEARIAVHLDEDPQQDLLDEINEEALEFETDHPDIVATVRSLVNMLSNLGI